MTVLSLAENSLLKSQPKTEMAANVTLWPAATSSILGTQYLADLLKQGARMSELQGREGNVQGETCTGSCTPPNHTDENKPHQLLNRV